MRCVGNQDAERSSRAAAVENAADNLKLVALDPGCGDASRRPSEGQLVPDEGIVNHHSGGKPVNHRSDERAVAFSENRCPDACSETVLHNPSVTSESEAEVP